MIALVITYCLAGGAACREQRIVLGDISPMACMVEGERAAQDWLAEHPKWRLHGWRCEVNVPRQVPA